MKCKDRIICNLSYIFGGILMQLINSQYRVIEIVEEDKFGSKYFVQDIYKDNMIKKMRVIENAAETAEFIEYMKVNFFDYVNIIHPNIAVFYYFNRVRVINTKPILSNKFYYTYEYFKGDNIFEYAKGKNIEELLDITIQLCSAIKYLHLRGFMLSNINGNEIYVVEKEGKKLVKISAFPYPVSIDNSIMINKNNSYFKSPEALQFGQYGKENDIYLLGITIYHMFTNENIEGANFKESLSKYNPSSPHMEKIITIVEKCTEGEISNRYGSIDEIISDINKSFNKTYNIIDKRYIQTLPLYSTKLVAREHFIQQIISSIRTRFYEEKNIKATIVTGGFGTGKGAFLNGLLTRIDHEGEYTVYTDVKSNSLGDYSAISEIIRKTLKYVNKELIDKYYDQLCKIIPEITTERQPNIFSIREEEDEAYKTTYRLGNFLLEASLKWPFIIVIKNYEYMDEQSKAIIKYIMANQNKGKTYFVFSFNKEISQNEVVKLFEPYLVDSELDIIYLSNFNIYETAEAIRILLGMDAAPINFAAKVYKETEGNPYFVYETIYELFLDNRIYVDDRGQWVFDDVDFSKINYSFNIDEMSQSKISKLEPVKKEILNIISVFNTAVSADILESILGTKVEELVPLLESLIYINILSRKMDDWGISYDFNSISLKKSIYESLSEYDKYKYHEKASQILEKKFNAEKRENKDELIYHMSKSGRCEEAVEYLIVSSNEMIKKGLFNQAIQFLEQSYGFFDEDDMCAKKTEVCLKLGDLYYQMGEYDKCRKYYKIAEKNVINSEDKRLISDVFIKMVKLNYKMNDIKKCLEYSKMAKIEIRSIGYKEGMLDLILALSDLMIYRRKHNSYMKIIEKSLNSLDDENKYYYGMLMSVYGRTLAKKYRFEEALNVLNESIEILEELKEYEGLVSALNAIGTIYSDYYNDIEKAKEYFERTLTICQRINNISYMVYSYNNLAEMYRVEDKFSESLNYYSKALGLAELSKNTYVQAMLQINCATISMEMEDFKKYIHFMDKARAILFTYKEFGEAMQYYYINEGIFHYLMGGFEDALDYAQKSVDMCINWGIQADSEAVLIINLCKAKLNENMDFGKLMGFCRETFDKKRYKTGRQACNKFAELFIDRESYDEAKNFLELSEAYKEYIDTYYLDAHYRYLIAMTYEGEKRVALLTNLIDLIDRLDNNEIKWKVYRSLGLELLNTGDYQGALNNLITSLNCLRMFIDGVPNEYKVKFLVSHNRNTVKEMLLKLAQKVTGKEGFLYGTATLIGEIKDVDQCINEYFDYKRFRDIIIKGDSISHRMLQDINETIQGKFLLDFIEIVSKFDQNTEDNIKKLVKLLMNITQSKNAFVAVIDENNEVSMLYSKLKNENNSFYKYIIEKTMQNNESIMITDAFEYKNKVNDSCIPKDICAVFCIPIMSLKDKNDLNKDRRKNKDFSHIKGYLYLDTDSIINNFSEETGRLCIAASKIIYVLIENYNLKIVTAVDKLTKLYTRKYFEHSLQKEISNAAITGGKFSIIMADIDKFKSVNDRFGHQVGDEVLSKISAIIMENVRKTDICARYGGEEFIILLPSTDSEGAFNLGEKLRKKIETSYLVKHHNTITISMGIATYPEHSIWMRDLIDKADQALYYSKENGRNNTTIYDANMVKTARRVDKLAGIVSGNLVEDMRNVETMIEILEFQRNHDIAAEEKMFSFLGRAIEISEAETGSIFIIDEYNEPVKQISRKNMVNHIVEDVPYNKELLKKCIETVNGEYLIDWSNSVSIDSVTGMPNWQSKMIIPMTNGKKLHAVLYLAVPLKNKEFDANIYNFIKTLCDIISPVFLQKNGV